MIIYSLNLNKNQCVPDDSPLYAYISQERINRINRLKFKEDKKVLLFSELLLRKVAKQYNVNNENIKILIGKFGKPYIKGQEKFCFSISHTRSNIIMAVDDIPLGVDIEELNLPHSYEKIIYHFTCDEQSYIKNNGSKSMESLLEVWTKKEACLKALGVGLYKNLNSFSVLEDNRYRTYKKNGKIVSLFSFDASRINSIKEIRVSEEEINNYFLVFEGQTSKYLHKKLIK